MTGPCNLPSPVPRGASPSLPLTSTNGPDATCALEAAGETKAVEQHASFSSDGRIAWYGAMRGSGVLRLEGERRRIVHCNVTFLVPNDPVPKPVTMVRDLEEK